MADFNFKILFKMHNSGFLGFFFMADHDDSDIGSRKFKMYI